MNPVHSCVILVALTLLSACGSEPPPLQTGPAPELPAPERGWLPDMTIAEPAAWGDKLPTVPNGYQVRAIATDLLIPRQTWCFPTGTSWSPKDAEWRAELSPGYRCRLHKSKARVR